MIRIGNSRRYHEGETKNTSDFESKFLQQSKTLNLILNDYLEHDKLQDQLKSKSDLFIEQHESRIKKTESDQDIKHSQPLETFQEELEEEEEESENEGYLNPDHQLVYPGYDEAAEDQYYYPPDTPYTKGDNYGDENIASERYNTKDYENVISTTYAKARKYKRKAKKLYTNLQKLKSHYTKAKRKIGKLEAENQRLTDQIVIFARRVDEVEDAYDRL